MYVLRGKVFVCVGLLRVVYVTLIALTEIQSTSNEEPRGRSRMKVEKRYIPGVLLRSVVLLRVVYVTRQYSRGSDQGTREMQRDVQEQAQIGK